MEEVKMVEPLYYRDSREEHLNKAYSYCDVNSGRESDDDENGDAQ